jgi:endonuclease/exonuclease/phosphatase family metal-dependent hydrolase
LARRAVAKKQMPQRLAMELAIHDPAIINFSESPSKAVTDEVAKLLEMNVVRFPSGGNWPGTLLSRFEIVNPQNAPVAGGQRPNELFTRHWGRAVIKLPKGQELVVHSAHLHPAEDPTIRLREVKAMLAAMEEDLDSGRSMLLIGDLNHTPDSQEYQLWRDAGWVDTFSHVGKGQGLTFTADAPYKRIDYVMATGPMVTNLLAATPLFLGAFRLNVDDEQSFALSDHLPQSAVFDISR